MKAFIVGSRKFIMDNRFNPLRNVDSPAQNYFTQMLTWMWGMILSLSFCSIFQFQIIWLAHLLIIVGAFTTISIVKYAQARPARKPLVADLSHGSVCVWKMDREA
ncbi:MAG: hypothetical protein ACI9D5_001891 [Candidatus Endobugula sp.]|jgi:hypothetical protein